MPSSVEETREKKSLGGIIQKPGTIANTPPNQTTSLAHPSPSSAPLTLPHIKMNSLRTFSRVALRAKPTRSLFAATRTYADAAGPADKIRLSLALPHQVRGHSIVELEGL